ncbi:TraB/GumN family protein [Dyella humicola]|uniref:TraB/GumN family protein n=1 Tax=Dyella humicola TaxID=2992126 RepID=UPI00224CD3E5|nr:TraB/GumN family protein [Dyella humicola]
MQGKIAIYVAALIMAMPVWAQSAVPPANAASAIKPPSPDSVVSLQAVTVTGQQPGPALWRVRRGDHILWVLGTLSPLPKHAEWQTAQVEKVLASAKELLEPPSAELKMPTSLFNRLALQPSARLNPDGATLQKLLPPEMYDRWLVLRRQYLGNDDALEYLRPIVVAQQLYEAALASAGLTNETDVAAIVQKLARKHGTRVLPVTYQLLIPHAPPLAQTADQGRQQDIACLDQTMHLVEHDMGTLTKRANAWATGDMRTLQSLSQGATYESCVVAAINGDFAQQLNIPDLPQRIEKAWMEAAESSLVRNNRSVAVLSMEQILAPDGFLAKLKAQGYRVEAPDEQN